MPKVALVLGLLFVWISVFAFAKLLAGRLPPTETLVYAIGSAVIAAGLLCYSRRSKKLP